MKLYKILLISDPRSEVEIKADSFISDEGWVMFFRKPPQGGHPVEVCRYSFRHVLAVASA